jgi:hypothetical protein
MWTNTQDNKLQSVQLRFSCVAVIQLPQEEGNHAYMPSNVAQLADICSCCKAFRQLFLHSVVGPLHFTHPEGVPMFWQIRMFSLLRNTAWHARRWLMWNGSWYGGCVCWTDCTTIHFFESLYLYHFKNFSRPYTEHFTIISSISTLICVSF